MNIKTFILDAHYLVCPQCDAELDAATTDADIHSKAPKEGDLSICLYCASRLIYK